MKPGDKVKFVGPEYVNADGPTVGQEGTLTARDGYTTQKRGQKLEELVTVRFDGSKRATVLSINRIAPV